MIIKRSRECKSMFINQTGFTKDIHSIFDLSQEDVVPTPATDKLFDEPENNKLTDEKLYRHILMKLMFLRRTRPDIKFA